MPNFVSFQLPHTILSSLFVDILAALESRYAAIAVDSDNSSNNANSGAVVPGSVGAGSIGRRGTVDGDHADNKGMAF